ncbi:hypothetical protein PV11_08908 [Exophiala sideris]|uniref:Xaa-Pro dipeptidyl-peptidase-like domain-containing protein n=1 Tax=Exophiala sideris TaxID=1016849 RepID=A0A0D1Y2G5_9EURO|nr:hypothetical protein PV11_08908 [Exophiala sideris]
MPTAENKPAKQGSIEFYSDGLTIRGELRLPQGAGPFPIVVLAQGLGALKEWTIPQVVDALVEVGIAGLSLDYRNFGDSEGEPRQEVAHYGRLEDWQNAISFATSLPEIDPQRVGIWGTSLGGRDVLAVAVMDRRVKVVVSQTPLIKWTHTTAARMAGYGDNLERYQRELAEDRQNRALGKKPKYVPFVKASGDDVKKAFIEGLSKAELRNYDGRLTLQTYQPTVLTDVTTFMGLISPAPLRVILAEEDFLPGQREAYEEAREPKSLVMVKGNHFSPYLESKSESIKAATDWFVEHL